MSELATSYHLVVYTALIVVAMPILGWSEAKR
jgi:hypothetical protein